MAFKQFSIAMLFGWVVLAVAPAFAQNASVKVTAHPAVDPLLSGFRNPPAAAKPRVWWHWMDGNITKDGIRRDLEWMHRIGIGGADIIDASAGLPQVVKHRLVYMTPAWKDAFRYAVALGDKLGMEMSIDASPGWSETGGPWVSPQQAMKKLVWSSIEVEGGRAVHETLPRPPDNPGPFQNAEISGDIKPSPRAASLHFYRDSAVIAYRTPAEEPVVTDARSNAGSIDKAVLFDGDLTKGIALKPPGENATVWIQLAFEKPARIQGASLALSVPRPLGMKATIEASDDGKNWTYVADFPKAAQLQRLAMVQQTISFPPATGRIFRVMVGPAEPLPNSLRPRAPALGIVESASAAPPARVYLLRELVFHTDATVHEFEKKAQFAAPPRDFYALAGNSDFAAGTAIAPSDVIDLTAKMKPDGTLGWIPPPGHWTVLRMGYSLTGAENHPATAEATGLEADKLNRAHVRAYLEHYLDMVAKVTGPRLFGARGLQGIQIDSSEIGQQNWTEDILPEFRRLRGYDPLPWLPVLTGAVVRSPEDSDKFLWDFRRTIEQLFARNHYGEIAEIARDHHLINYGEAIEDHRPTFGDDMEMRQYTTIPMAAMWTYGEKYPSALTYEADILGAASVAHIYGQKLVAAESLTSALQPWSSSPRDLKPFIDMEFVRGVNRVVIHTSVHQPVNRAPGLSLFGYGQFFTRLESWAGQAGAWTKYIARCSYLLQQGRYAADVAYFYGEEAPLTSLFGDRRVTEVPNGYGFDFVNADALEHRLAVKNGELVTPTGMRYRVLYLGGSSSRMTLGSLRRIRDLAEQGAIVVGQRPVSSPSLADDPSEFANLAQNMFGDGNNGKRTVGEGAVYPSGSLSEALADLHVLPDFESAGTEPDLEILSTHRRISGGDVYFVSNRNARPETFMATFRVSGLVPEVWDAVTGKVASANFTATDGRTRVPMLLPANGSAFVIFRKATAKSSRDVSSPLPSTVKTLVGPWKAAFAPGRGAPAHVVLNRLQSWSDSNIDGVRYFSGTATYTKAFMLPKSVFLGKAKLVLDLGDVGDVATVWLNGKIIGTVWTSPFQLDVTAAVRPGANVLKVDVANLWVNRLIGDAQRGAGIEYTFTTIPTYRADAPLRGSGLLGPVELRREIGAHSP